MTTPEYRPPGPAGPPMPVGPGGSAPGAPSPGMPGPVTGPPATSPPAAPSRSTGKTIGRTLAAALLVFVTVMLVLFVVFNTQTVDISLVFTDVEASLVLALVIAAGLGGLVVLLAGAAIRARRRNR